MHEIRLCPQLDEVEEVGGVLVTARQDATDILEPSEQVFDLPATLVGSIVRHSTVRLRPSPATSAKTGPKKLA